MLEEDAFSGEKNYAKDRGMPPLWARKGACTVDGLQ